MKIIHEITLDVSRHGIQASIPLTQHDAGMHSLLIHLRNGSREIKLSEDITATLYVSNDTYEDVIVYTDNGAYPNTLECNITPYITKDTGEYTAQLQIYENGTKLFSAPEFTMIIKADRSNDSQVISSPPFAAVITARDAARSAASDAQKSAEEVENTAKDLREELGNIPVYTEDTLPQEPPSSYFLVTDGLISAFVNGVEIVRISSGIGAVNASGAITYLNGDDFEKLKQFTENGKGKVVTPIEDDDIANKKYVDDLRNYGDNTYANALVGNERGTIVSMDDVSPVMHKIPVKVRSKNLIPYPYRTTTTTIDGVTFTDNGDGTITLNGTATNAIVYSPVATSNAFYIEPGIYTVSSDVVGSYDSVYVQFKGVEGDANLGEVREKPKSFTITEGIHGRFNIRIAAGASFSDVIVKPQLEHGTTATPYTPYVADDTEVTVKSCGKNLLTPQQIYSGADKYLETEYDGRNCVRFTSAAANHKVFNCFKPNTQYTFTIVYSAVNFVDVGQSNRLIEIRYTDGTKTVKNTLESEPWTKYTLTTDIGKTIERVGIGSVGYKSYVYVDVDNFQVEEGATATAYEPYKEGETVHTTVSESVELTSVAPNMTITTDTTGALVECSYNKDTNAVINNLFAEIANLKATITDLGGTT